MMKLAKRAAALVLAAVLALSLTACSPKEVASNLILKTADLLGLREEGSDDDEADEIVAQPGGEVSFPDGLLTFKKGDRLGDIDLMFRNLANS